MKRFARTLPLVIASFAAVPLLDIPSGFAQEQLQDIIPKANNKTDEKLRSVQLQQQVKPAFLIKPLVHRLQGRKSQLLKFEFSIEAHERPSRLEIRPVAMTQQENGVIMPDEKALAPDLIRVTSEPSVDLALSEEHVIRGEMRIPQTIAPFLSYGILVREIPRDDDPNGGAEDEARVGIRFVTQYLLRVDVDVLGVKGDSVAALQLQDAGFVEQDGRCMARLFVNNPTDTAMEFAVDCQLLKNDTQAVGKKFGLVVPVRAGQQPPDRYRARILAKTRLRLEEFLPHPVFPGEYTLVADLSHEGRVLRKVEFSVAIKDGDFPGQDARVVRVAQDITVEPPQVELSLRKGGRRIESIAVRNDSLQKVRVKLAPVPLQGDFHTALQLRPNEFELPAGQSRKVIVTVDSKREITEHGYAFAELTVSPEVGEAIGTHRIPVAILTNSESLAQLIPGDLKSTLSNDRAGFTIPVRNDGLRHVPLSGRLSLTDEFGRGLVVDGGYGTWLLPGQAETLFFGFREPPPPGTYQVQVRIDQNEGEQPLEITQTIRLESQLEQLVPESEKVSGQPADNN